MIKNALPKYQAVVLANEYFRKFSPQIPQALVGFSISLPQLRALMADIVKSRITLSKLENGEDATRLEGLVKKFLERKKLLVRSN